MVEARRVFLCHASEDKEIAVHMCDVLEANNVPCWIAPRDIEPGRDYGEGIIGAIEEARALVLILSTHSNESEHVKREVERAVNKGIEIIPFRIEDILPSKSLEYYVSTTQWVDAFTPPLDNYINFLMENLKGLPAEPVKPKSWLLRWQGLVIVMTAILVVATGIWGAFYLNRPLRNCEILEQIEQPRWPWTSNRFVTDTDLAPWSNECLDLMRNEIYARKGWIFKRNDLRDYFEKQKWYKPAGDPTEADKLNDSIEKGLNKFERENVRRIRAFQDKRR